MFFKYKIYSIEETLDLLLKNNLSLIRFEDGEINLFSGENIYFQDYLSKIYDDF